MAAAIYECKFVKIELKMGFSRYAPQEDYHEIIQNLSKEGWRLVQVFAPGTRGVGLASYFELIFERPSE